MGSKRYLFHRLMESEAFSTQPLASKPVIEMAGNNRVLIENHHGVKEYGNERILVQVSFGCVAVIGTNLEMLRMTKEQLVISGCIHCVQLLRKEET